MTDAAAPELAQLSPAELATYSRARRVKLAGFVLVALFEFEDEDEFTFQKGGKELPVDGLRLEHVEAAYRLAQDTYRAVRDRMELVQANLALRANGHQCPDEF